MAINKHPLFKGHVKIELSDGQTVEGDNMVTNAVSYFYKNGGLTNPSAFNASNIRANALYYLLGGVMCLDTALTQDADVVRVPPGVHMTANGARDVVNNGNPSELGTFNALESGFQQDGSLKLVWDWPTSGGNGTIASVCLSSLYGGMLGVGNKASKTNKTNAVNPSIYNSVISLSGYSGIPVGIKDNILYCVGGLYGVTEWTVRKYAMPYTMTDIRDTQEARLLEEITVQIPAEIQNLVDRSAGAGMAESYFFKNNTAVIYIGHKDSRGDYPTTAFSDEYPAYIIKYNIGTGTVTAQVLNTTNTGISYPPVNQYSFYYGASDEYAIIGNNCVNLSNLADVRTIDNLPATQRIGTSSYYGLEAITNKTFLSSAGNYYIETEDPSGYPVNEYTRIGAQGALSDNPLMMFAGNCLIRDPRYIATIFNLSSPITKTADKTMKVTYVIRFNAA